MSGSCSLYFLWGKGLNVSAQHDFIGDKVTKLECNGKTGLNWYSQCDAVSEMKVLNVILVTGGSCGTAKGS